jgi:hypothetical protein
MIRDGQANVVELSAMNHPNVRTGRDIIPGAVDRETVVRRINIWSRPLREGEEKPSADSIFTVPDFLAGARAKNPQGGYYPGLVGNQIRKITVPVLSYTVLGRYPAQGVNQLISDEWINNARSRWDSYVSKFGEVFPIGVKPIMGLDVAGEGDDLNCCMFRAGGFVPTPIVWNKVDTVFTGDRGATEYRKANALRAFIDANGVGTGVAPHMRRLNCPNAMSVMVQAKGSKVSEVGQFKIMRDQLWWLMREWLRADPGAMLPPEEKLLEELRTPTYEVVKGKVEVMKREDIKEKLHRSPDYASALALTFADSAPENRAVFATPVQIEDYPW